MAKNKNSGGNGGGMDFDDGDDSGEVTAENSAAANSPTLVGNAGTAPANAPAIGPPGSASIVATKRPYCMRHNVLMRANGSKESVRYYKCPVPGCDASEKEARPADPIPREPAACPQRTCQEPKRYLEVDPRTSNAGTLAMVCPGCGFCSRVPRPQIAFVNQQIRAAEEARLNDLSVR